MPDVTIASAEQGTMRTASDLIFGPLPESSGLHHNSELFDDWFSRRRGTLHSTACRVLGGSEGADLAVQNCRRLASCLRAFIMAGVTIKWLIFILWACL
jgi:hypothetical protein